MSFGLNKFLKIILPKGLFYRSLIIVAAPTIILQLIITIVFFDSLWIKTNKGMTRSLIGEIKTLVDVYNKGNTDQINFKTSNNTYLIILIIYVSLQLHLFYLKFITNKES